MQPLPLRLSPGEDLRPALQAAAPPGAATPPSSSPASAASPKPASAMPASPSPPSSPATSNSSPSPPTAPTSTPPSPTPMAPCSAATSSPDASCAPPRKSSSPSCPNGPSAAKPTPPRAYPSWLLGRAQTRHEAKIPATAPSGCGLYTKRCDGIRFGSSACHSSTSAGQRHQLACKSRFGRNLHRRSVVFTVVEQARRRLQWRKHIVQP